MSGRPITASIWTPRQVAPWPKDSNVKAITRDKEYDLTAGAEGSKLYYFSANPNGESELIQVQLTPGSKARNKVFNFDFVDLDIKGRGSKGNILTQASSPQNRASRKREIRQ